MRTRTRRRARRGMVMVAHDGRRDGYRGHGGVRPVRSVRRRKRTAPVEQ